MTQLFIGHKPGVGPVVKILKHDGDDPLTLANDAYDRYIFNSENQKISYAFGLYSLDVIYPPANGVTSGTIGRINVGGDDDTAWFTAWGTFYWRGFPNNTLYNGDIVRVVGYSRPDKVFPDRNMLPMFHATARSYDPSEWITCAMRTMTQIVYVNSVREGWCFTSSQPAGGYKKVKARVAGSDVAFSNEGFNWEGTIQQFFSNIPVGEWVGMRAPHSGDGSNTLNNVMMGGASYAPGGTTLIHYYWSLPADDAPMPTYDSAAGKEIVRLDRSRVAIARPGFDVATDSGMGKMILDSDGAAPALCVMAGVTSSIPNGGGTVSLPIPAGISLGNQTVVETMVKYVAGDQFIPAHAGSGWIRNNTIDVSYRVYGGNLEFRNNSTQPVVVTYFVFTADEMIPSTGGHEIIWEGNDGTQDYFQIKRPGTSDPASRAADILLDSRYPMVSILAEGWLPLADFVANGESPHLLGTHCKDVFFDAAGMVPFVKFTTVFPDYILPPIMSLAMTWQQPFSDVWGPPSNQSSLCRLRADDGVARFYLSPANFTRMRNDNNFVQFLYDGPAPLGIRYYILGIPAS